MRRDPFDRLLFAVFGPNFFCAFGARSRVLEAIDSCREQEARLLRERFGVPCAKSTRTLKEIATEEKISPERVRQVVERGLARLRSPGRAQFIQGLRGHLPDEVKKVRIGKRGHIPEPRKIWQ